MDVKKRIRSPNFTQEEINILLNILIKFKDVIENKKTDAVTWREKHAAWSTIAELFNSCSPNGFYRTPEALKKMWENKKKETRRNVAKERVLIRKTGGGKKEDKHDPNEALTLSMMNKKSLFGLTNTYDCDMDCSNIPSASCHPDEFATTPSHNDEADEVTENILIINEKAGSDEIEPSEVDWGNNKASNLKTPTNRKLKRNNSSWTSRRRPVIASTSTGTLSSQYSELAKLKIEHMQLQLEILKEEKKNQQLESDLRKQNLQLEIQIKEKQLEKIMKQM